MNVQPQASLVSLAGVQRAATRSGDAQTTAAHQSRDQQRAEHPAGRGEGGVPVEAGDAAGDGEADGRQMLHQQPRHDQPPHDQQPPKDAPGDPAPQPTGGQVDYQA